MALRTSSRYTYKTGGTIELIEAVRKSNVATTSYSKYVSREGDTFEILATRLYNDPTQYWRIADMNPQVKFPDVIPAGTTIRLPA